MSNKVLTLNRVHGSGQVAKELAETGKERLTLSVDEAAALSGIGRDRLYALCRASQSNGFPAIWLGRRVYIHRAKFEQWLDECAGSAAAGYPSN